MYVSVFLHEFSQKSFLKLYKLNTKCNLKFNDTFVGFCFKMYLQLLKKAGKISYFFICTLAKQNKTQGAFRNMITLYVFKRNESIIS